MVPLLAVAANLMQQVYRTLRRLYSLVMFGSFKQPLGSEKHRRPRAPPVGFSCFPAQYCLPREHERRPVMSS